MKQEPSAIQYNRAKTWQLMCFPLNNTATNLFAMIMGYASYLAVGGYGIAVVLVSTIVTASRIFDAITDPIIGFVIDKTNSRFGKFRPMIFIGWAIMVLSLLTMFFWGIGGNVVTFTIIYLVYIIGYTFQTACTKAGQTCITNDPKQRPVYSRCDAIYNTLIGTGVGFYLTNYLQPKYGQFNVAALQEYCMTGLIIATVFSALAIAALWTKDVPENHGLGAQNKPPRFRDLVSILKGNRPLQMLIVAASTDKLAGGTSSNSAIGVVLFGIIIGNYALSGQMGLITMIPTILIVLFGTRVAGKKGSKKALVQFTWISILMCALLLGVYLIFDPTQIGKAIVPTVLFIVLRCMLAGSALITNSITVPMIADCADYELYRTGRYVSGMIGTVFSFVDKIVSSFSSTIVGLMLASIGYVTVMPQVGDPSTPALFWVTMFLTLGMPVLGWIASLIAMRFYKLDAAKMREIQSFLSQKKGDNASEVAIQLDVATEAGA